MARYKLLQQHYSEEDKLLEAGTEVGDGTEHEWTQRPTPQMEPLDEEARAAIDRERVRAREVNVPWVQGRIAPIDDLPLTMAEVGEKYDREVREGAAEIAQRSAPPRPATTLADRARR